MRVTASGLLYGATPCAPWIVREASPPAARAVRLLDRVRDAIRSRHYSRRTEKAYTHWIRRLIFFHSKQKSRLTKAGNELVADAFAVVHPRSRFDG